MHGFRLWNIHKLKSLKSVAMATTVARDPQNLITSRSSLAKYILKIFEYPCMVLGCGTPTSFMPAAVTRMV